MLRKFLARLLTVRVLVTAIATVVTGAALAVFAIVLVATVEHRLEAHVRADSRNLAQRVATAIQSGQPAQQAVGQPALGNAVFVTGEQGNVIAASFPIGSGSAAGSAGPLGPLAVPGPNTAVEVTQEFVSSGGKSLTVIAASPLADVQRSVHELSNVLWFGIPTLVLVVAMLAWWLVGRALKPVDAMRREVDEISHTTLHRRLPEPATCDEIARLAHTMNRMLDRLERGAARQREFVSDASHELRSPLATIRTKVEVAGVHDDSEWHDVRDTVIGEVDRLDELVGDLLQLARLDENATALERADVDLDDLVVNEVARLRSLGMTVDDSGVGAVRLSGDRSALGRLVRNLADNAARHANGQVALSTGIEGRDAWLVVDDDGPGVPIADRERVFERFTRLDEARSRSSGGSGLGLALVRAVAIAHDGQVRVGESPLGGARFEARLALRHAPFDPALEPV